MFYKYKVIGSNNKFIKGVINADDLDDLKQVLYENGFKVITINGFRGIAVAIFVVLGLIAGFIISLLAYIDIHNKKN